jgi:hypothetical protein
MRRVKVYWLVMRWICACIPVLVGCGARSDLSSPPSIEAGAASAVTCNPGDAIVVVATLDAARFASYALATDGVWLYGVTVSGLWSMPVVGGAPAMLTTSTWPISSPPNEVAAWQDGVLFNGSDGVDWIRHDGTGRRNVLPIPASIIAPPKLIVQPALYDVRITDLDGSTSGNLAVLENTAFTVALTSRFLHLGYETLDNTGQINFDDRIDLKTQALRDSPVVPFYNVVSGPNAVCSRGFALLDEMDAATPLAYPATPILVDDAWAYLPIAEPPSVVAVGLRSNAFETIVPSWVEVPAGAAAEANGCIYFLGRTASNPDLELIRVARP